MQPHSMCVVSLVGLLWNSIDRKKVSRCEMRVEYTKRGSYAFHSYELSNIYESPDRRELRVSVMRAGGGLSCTVNARRTSLEEGAQVTMTHDTIHVAGLREVFNLYRLKVSSGQSQNSRLYKGFGGEFQTDDYKKLDLYCEVLNDNEVYVPVRYQIERVSATIES